MININISELKNVGDAPVIVRLEDGKLYSNTPESIEGYVKVFDLKKDREMLRGGKGILDLAEDCARSGVSTVLVDSRSIYVPITEYNRIIEENPHESA